MGGPCAKDIDAGDRFADVGAGESSPALDGSALVDALRDTHRHIEELERIQAESPRCVMSHEAKERAKLLTERIIALSQNGGLDRHPGAGRGESHG